MHNFDRADIAPDYLTGCPSLAAAYRRSCVIVDTLRDRFVDGGFGSDEVVCVVAAGSLGRLEVTKHSDLDAIVVLAAAGSAATEHRVRHLLGSVGLKASKPAGIFASAITRGLLLDPRGWGRLSEEPAVFGKRMQLLLDGRAVHAPAAFRALRREVLGWYAAGSGPGERFGILIHDLARYLHSYTVWQRSKRARSVDDAWLLRQAKLASTRVPTVLGLLFALAEHGAADVATWEDLLDAPPLGRLCQVMACAGHEEDAERLARIYEHLHACFEDTAFRSLLLTSGPDETTATDAPLPDAAAEFLGAAATMQDLLIEFALAQRARWPAAFYRDWLL